MELPDATFSIVLLSCKVSLFACLGTLPFAIGFGWWFSISRSRLRPFIEGIVLAPLVLPPVAVGLILLNTLAPKSFLGGIYASLFGEPIILSWHAAVLAVAVVSFPLTVKSIQGAFKDVPRRYQTLAQTLGLSPLKVLIYVTMPLSFRGILNGVLLGFARGLGEFGATVLVAGIIPGQTETLALGIYDRIQTGRDQEAWGLVAVALVLALMALAISLKLQSSQPQYIRGRA